MKSSIGIVALAIQIVFGSASALAAGLAVPITLTRLDCGTMRANDLDVFSDTHAYPGQKMEITDSCYLIRHGEQIMLWNTGLPASALGAKLNDTDAFSLTLRKTIVDQLAALGLKPEQVTIVGLSHYHFDHTGQAASFPKAKLIIGAGDWAAVKTSPAPFGLSGRDFAPWTGGGAVEPIVGDKDVFGDGTVTMLAMPGHTSGHHALLVRLKDRGPILLSGDTAHFAENYTQDGVPGFNTDRADTVASIGRLKALAANMKATVIIEHDPRDIAKLPEFPQAAD